LTQSSYSGLTLQALIVKVYTYINKHTNTGHTPTDAHTHAHIQEWFKANKIVGQKGAQTLHTNIGVI
jgi:hypothetical protein